MLPALNKDWLIDWILFCLILGTYSVTAGPQVLIVSLEYCLIFRHGVTSYMFCPESMFMICSVFDFVLLISFMVLNILARFVVVAVVLVFCMCLIVCALWA